MAEELLLSGVMAYFHTNANGEGPTETSELFLTSFIEDPNNMVTMGEIMACNTCVGIKDFVDAVKEYAARDDKIMPDRVYNQITRMMNTMNKIPTEVGKPHDRDARDRESPSKQVRVIELGSDSEDEEPVISYSAVTTKDLEAHGVSDVIEVALLSGLIVTGHMPPVAEAKLFYGRDWRTSLHARTLTKANIGGLFKCKTYLEIVEYFSSLVTTLTGEGKSTMALRVNQFITETVATLGVEYKALIEYFKAYFTRTYMGRGIPVTIDPGLIVRFKGGDANDMAKRVEEAEERARLMADVVKNMKADAKELKKSVERLERTRSRTNEEEKKKAALKSKLKCFRCGGNHLVKECPEEDMRTEQEKTGGDDSE